jgi:hypothetical protein
MNENQMPELLPIPVPTKERAWPIAIFNCMLKIREIVNPFSRRAQTKIGMMMVDVLFLVCTDCGYYEKYVESEDQLKKLPEK